MKRNFKMQISYDGTRYQGWEHQPTTDMTIQGKIETVLSKMVEMPEGKVVDVIAAGRTDAGVHAKAMIANVQLDTNMTEEQILAYANRYLPEDICVDELKAASARFHARYNAIGKTYCYSCYFGTAKPVFDRKYVTVLEEMPDVEQMKKAAAFLTGTHDYKSYCSNPRMKKTTVRCVDSIKISQNGPYIHLYFHGNGFLQNMVRIMTGTLLEVGFGRMKPEQVREILEAGDRKLAGPTAKPCGLCLIEVDY